VKSAQNNAPRYAPEVLSPQQRRAWKEKFSRLSRSQLKEIEAELVLAYRSKANIEKEIAVGHFDPELVAEVIKTEGKNKKLQTIYCSIERCEHCPHGPYWYVFRKSLNEIRIRLLGQPTFDQETVQWLRQEVEAEPLPTPYEIKWVKPEPSSS
jgi:hypothetical protein